MPRGMDKSPQRGEPPSKTTRIKHSYEYAPVGPPQSTSDSTVGKRWGVQGKSTEARTRSQHKGYEEKPRGPVTPWIPASHLLRTSSGEGRKPSSMQNPPTSGRQQEKGLDQPKQGGGQPVGSLDRSDNMSGGDRPGDEKEVEAPVITNDPDDDEEEDDEETEEPVIEPPVEEMETEVPIIDEPPADEIEEDNYVSNIYNQPPDNETVVESVKIPVNNTEEGLAPIEPTDEITKIPIESVIGTPKTPSNKTNISAEGVATGLLDGDNPEVTPVSAGREIHLNIPLPDSCDGTEPPNERNGSRKELSPLGNDTFRLGNFSDRTPRTSPRSS